MNLLHAKTGPAVTGSGVAVSVSAEEAALVAWAIKESVATFEEVVAKGYLRRLPAIAVLEGTVLRLPLDMDALEELDYQLTIGVREYADQSLLEFDPAVGDRVSRRIRARLPGNFRLSV